jgi:hypothetical protein
MMMLKNAQRPPVCVKVFGSLAAAAKNQRSDSAMRLWHLARMVDDGSGVVAWSALQDVIDRYIGTSQRHIRRLVAECERLGWLEPIQRHNGEHVVIVRGLERVAQGLGVVKISQGCYIPARELRKLKAWRVACWDAFMAGRSGRRSRPISRRVLERISGVDPRSQRNYERSSARITSRRNIAITRRPSTHLDGIIEFEKRPAFRVVDDVAWMLPNSYSVSADLAPRGMARRISKRLSGGLLQLSGDGQHRKRIFYGRRRAARVMRRADRPHEVYGRCRQPARSGAGVWQYMGVNAAI